MSALTVYPRRFTTRNDGDGHLKSDGDPSVVMLYEDLCNHTTNTRTWGYRKRVVDAAVRLFGHFPNWLRDQQRNPDVAGYSVLFLDDILSYIKTGRRQMSPMTWIGLMSEGDISDRTTLRFTMAEDSLKGQSTAEVIQQWCSHPDGVEDLAQSLFVLFGSKYQNS